MSTTEEEQTVQRSNGPLREREIHTELIPTTTTQLHTTHTRVCEALSLSSETMTVRTVSFRVAGHPVTQGSKRAFVVGGQARLVEAGGAKHKLWRNAVNDEARLAWAGRAPLDTPVMLTVAFALQPPKSRPKRRRTWPIGQRSGDLDKLLRAVLDSLTGVVYVDDAQVVITVLSKDWACPDVGPGVTITVIPIGVVE